jgi:hypothetical protein
MTDDRPTAAEVVGHGRCVVPAPLAELDLDVIDPWRRRRHVALVVHAVGVAIWTLTAGLLLDRISVALGLVPVALIHCLGRPALTAARVVDDATIYVAMWFVYESTRGIADAIGTPVQSTSVRDLDRMLTGGADASVALQRAWFGPDVEWFDVIGSLIYVSHYVVPVVALAVLWLSDRREWVRYMRRLATLLALGCVGFVLVPTAPPWMAGDPAFGYEVIDPVVRHAGRGLDTIGLDTWSRRWQDALDWANPVAAMPSLHAGFALFVPAFFLPRVRRRWWPALLAFPATMLLTLVYFGEHWIVDGLAGWLLVGIVFLIWHRVERLAHRRTATRAIAAIRTRPDAAATSPAGTTPCRPPSADSDVLVVGRTALDAITSPDDPHHAHALRAYTAAVTRWHRGSVRLVASTVDLRATLRRSASVTDQTIDVARLLGPIERWDVGTIDVEASLCGAPRSPGRQAGAIDVAASSA